MDYTEWYENEVREEFLNQITQLKDIGIRVSDAFEIWNKAALYDKPKFCYLTDSYFLTVLEFRYRLRNVNESAKLMGLQQIEVNIPDSMPVCTGECTAEELSNVNGKRYKIFAEYEKLISKNVSKILRDLSRQFWNEEVELHWKHGAKGVVISVRNICKAYYAYNNSKILENIEKIKEGSGTDQVLSQTMGLSANALIINLNKVDKMTLDAKMETYCNYIAGMFQDKGKKPYIQIIK